MKLTTFYNSYNLFEYEILSIKGKSNKLEMLIDMDSHLDLIGNGIRPSLDVSYHHLFKFEYEGPNINISKNIKVDRYEFKCDKIELVVNGIALLLTSDAEVIRNYE